MNILYLVISFLVQGLYFYKVSLLISLATVAVIVFQMWTKGKKNNINKGLSKTKPQEQIKKDLFSLACCLQKGAALGNKECTRSRGCKQRLSWEERL